MWGCRVARRHGPRVPTLECSRRRHPGASAQYFTGVLLEANGRDFNPIFLATSGVEVLGVLAFCSWWSSERQFD